MACALDGAWGAGSPEAAVQEYFGLVDETAALRWLRVRGAKGVFRSLVRPSRSVTFRWSDLHVGLVALMEE